MSTYLVNGDDLTAVADAIRRRTNVQGGGTKCPSFSHGLR